MIIIIPTVREINLKYLEPLIDSGARFIIVDDSYGSINLNHPSFSVYNWHHRKKILGSLDGAIPKKTGACRDFGFYMAWKESDDAEIIVAIDDDCDVYRKDFAQAVTNLLAPSELPVYKGSGVHFNALDIYENIESEVYPRGFPYSARYNYKPWKMDGKMTCNPVFNLGLWRGVFDINAIDKIQGPQWIYKEANLKHENVIVPKNAFISVCSMNMQFKRRVIPAVYQLPVHVEVTPYWCVDRYGDIWGGFILKLIMDIMGDTMTTGGPMIKHFKMENYEKNIWQEHICHILNEEFIGLLIEAKMMLHKSNYLQLMEELNEHFKKRTETSSPLLKNYLRHLTQCIDMWCKALQK